MRCNLRILMAMVVMAMARDTDMGIMKGRKNQMVASLKNYLNENKVV